MGRRRHFCQGTGSEFERYLSVNVQRFAAKLIGCQQLEYYNLKLAQQLFEIIARLPLDHFVRCNALLG